MQNKSTLLIISLLILLGGYRDLSAQEKWTLEKKVDGIEVYSLKNETKFNSFRGHMVLDQSIHSFVALLNDIESYVNWGYKLKEVSLLKRSGDTMLIYYALAQVPFPYKNREGVYRNSFRWFSKTSMLFIDIETIEGYTVRNQNYVEIKGKGFWKVLVLPSGKLDITFQMQIDPGGAIPSWLSNLFIAETPYNTLKNIRNLIKDKKYHDKSYGFIK